MHMFVTKIKDLLHNEGCRFEIKFAPNEYSFNL